MKNFYKNPDEVCNLLNEKDLTYINGMKKFTEYN